MGITGDVALSAYAGSYHVHSATKAAQHLSEVQQVEESSGNERCQVELEKASVDLATSGDVIKQLQQTLLAATDSAGQAFCTMSDRERAHHERPRARGVESEGAKAKARERERTGKNACAKEIDFGNRLRLSRAHLSQIAVGSEW